MLGVTLSRIHIDPSDCNWRFACHLARLLNAPLDPNPFGLEEVELLLSGLSHQLGVKYLAGEVVPEDLLAVDLDVENMSSAFNLK